MKSKSILRLSTIAFAITSSAYAQVVNIDNQTFHYGTLLTDNFNTASSTGAAFNDNLATDQSGVLGTVSYAVSNTDFHVQRDGAMVLNFQGNGWGGAYASLNNNFATDANTANQPLEIQFDMWVNYAAGADAWTGFGIGTTQGGLFWDYPGGFIVRQSDGYHTYKMLISDTAGTGSGFNGITDGAKIEFFIDGVSQGTTTYTLATDGGNLTFRTIPAGWGGSASWGIGYVDNLKITNGQETNPLATGTELNLSNNGIVNFGDVTQTVAKLDGTSGTQVNLVPVSGTSSLTVNGSADSSFAGVIGGSGGSLTKDGSGTLTLSGANTYTGATTVNAGNLVINGSTAAGSAVTVASGATLGGTGIIGGTLDVTGILAPGNSIGTLNAGTTTWNGGNDTAATIWQFELSDNSNASDSLNIVGNFLKDSTDGSTYKFDFMNSAPTTWGNVYTLATWTGTTNFTLSDFSWTNLGGIYDGQPGTGFTLTANSLTFTAVPEPTSALAGLLLTAGFLRRRRVV